LSLAVDEQCVNSWHGGVAFRQRVRLNLQGHVCSAVQRAIRT
jgi:hypothetical protein